MELAWEGNPVGHILHVMSVTVIAEIVYPIKGGEQE